MNDKYLLGLPANAVGKFKKRRCYHRRQLLLRVPVSGDIFMAIVNIP